MAVISKVVSDLDGVEDAKAFHFAIEGVEYSIDVTSDQKKQFLEVISSYTKAAKVTPLKQKATVHRDGTTRAQNSPYAHLNTPENRAILRVWAERTGVELNPAGRIPERVWEQFDEARTTGKLVAFSG